MAWVESESLRFGRIDAREEEIIHFPGVPGFPEARRFVFREHDCGVGFGWMLCVDDPALAFVVADPAQFVHGYAPEIPRVPFADSGRSERRSWRSSRLRRCWPTRRT